MTRRPAGGPPGHGPALVRVLQLVVQRRVDEAVLRVGLCRNPHQTRAEVHRLVGRGRGLVAVRFVQTLLLAGLTPSK